MYVFLVFVVQSWLHLYCLQQSATACQDATLNSFRAENPSSHILVGGVIVAERLLGQLCTPTPLHLQGERLVTKGRGVKRQRKDTATGDSWSFIRKSTDSGAGRLMMYILLQLNNKRWKLIQKVLFVLEWTQNQQRQMIMSSISKIFCPLHHVLNNYTHTKYNKMFTIYVYEVQKHC